MFPGLHWTRVTDLILRHKQWLLLVSLRRELIQVNSVFVVDVAEASLLSLLKAISKVKSLLCPNGPLFLLFLLLLEQAFIVLMFQFPKEVQNFSHLLPQLLILLN